MSFDIGIAIIKGKKSIVLKEINLSSGYKYTIGYYKTADEALAKLEDLIRGLNEEGVDYEGIVVKGFKEGR